MEDSILKFGEQFEFQPEIQNSEKLKKEYKNFILAGMGGSHLAADLFHIFRPGINLHIHQDYGLPPYEGEFMSESLLIASSFSGNTEEVIDFAEEAYFKGYDLAIITTGGKLLEFAKENKLPYVLMPNTGIQPRLAIGFASISLAAFVSLDLLSELQSLKDTIDPESFRESGSEIAKTLQNKVPMIYTSNQNYALAYLWKIIMNETAKIPSFCNVFPELNHNEMQSFDSVEINKFLSEESHFIILHDSEDNPKIELRMRVTEELYQEKGYSVTSLFLEGDSELEKIFKSFILVNWIALELSDFYKTNPQEVALIEEFKKRIV